MKSKLVYVELKLGEQTSVKPAWIGRAFYSKTGRTVYFNGLAFNGNRGWISELKSGDYYWISGVKKDGTDKYWRDNQPKRQKIKIDKDVVEEYLKFRSLSELPKNTFEVVTLDNIPPKDEYSRLENLTFGEIDKASDQAKVLSRKYDYATRNTRYKEAKKKSE